MWLVALASSIAAAVVSECGDVSRGPASVVELLGGPDAPADGTVRVATWNLRNFPGKGQDLGALSSRIHDLDADILAVQEIKDNAALEQLLPDRGVILSRGGGRGHQRLGFVYDPRRVNPVGAPTEHTELTMGGRVRPALSQRFAVRGSEETITAVSVHLKAMPKGAGLRRDQWLLLSTLASLLRDDTVLVLGDFNPVGGDGDSPREELAALDAAMARAGLRRLESEDGCSAYWDGPRRDAWKEPSLLDLIYVRGVPPGDLPEAAPGAHCTRHACESFRSTEAYPEPSFERLSDHCPVRTDLPLAAREGL